jgi:VanZ family protein
MTRTRTLLRAWAPALLWLALIAWESTSFFAAEKTGTWLAAVLTFLFGSLSPQHFQLAHELLRKFGHLFLYSILSLLCFRAWWATLRAKSGEPLSWRTMLSHWSLRAAAVALLMTVLVAAGDEWHQTLLPSRTGSIHDVLLDTMAAIFAQLALLSASAWPPARQEQEQG